MARASGSFKLIKFRACAGMRVFGAKITEPARHASLLYISHVAPCALHAVSMLTYLQKGPLSNDQLCLFTYLIPHIFTWKAITTFPTPTPFSFTSFITSSKSSSILLSTTCSPSNHPCQYNMAAIFHYVSLPSFVLSFLLHMFLGMVRLPTSQPAPSLPSHPIFPSTNRY